MEYEPTPMSSCSSYRSENFAEPPCIWEETRFELLHGMFEHSGNKELCAQTADVTPQKAQRCHKNEMVVETVLVLCVDNVGIQETAINYSADKLS